MWGKSALLQKRAWKLLLCTHGHRARPNNGTGIGDLQARCPCCLFRETKPANSHHPDPMTLNSHNPQESLPAGHKGPQINTSKVEMVIYKKVRFGSRLEEEDTTPNCRCGRTHLSPSQAHSCFVTLKRCYKLILSLKQAHV